MWVYPYGQGENSQLSILNCQLNRPLSGGRKESERNGAAESVAV